MISIAVILVSGLEIEKAASPIDAFMADVMQACVIPDLEANDPRAYLLSHGWDRRGETDRFSRVINGVSYNVQVSWPASKSDASSCSFEADDVSAVAAYDWLTPRLGEPQDIVWTSNQVGGWKIETNGHDAGIYLSRKNSNSKRAGMLLHVLQR